jgi:hypothetical protein
VRFCRLLRLGPRGEQIKLKVALASSGAPQGVCGARDQDSLDRARSLIERAETNDQPKDGRTSGYDAEIAEAICERVVSGESLRAICADPAMPARISPAVVDRDRSPTPIDVSRFWTPTGHCNRALSTRPLPT